MGGSLADEYTKRTARAMKETLALTRPAIRTKEEEKEEEETGKE